MSFGQCWWSLDPREAVSAVHEIDDKKALHRIAFEARNPEARRLALIKLGDKNLMETFAKCDKSPIVRRRMVRELDNEDIIGEIARNDEDFSVRESAYKRLKALKDRDADVD